MVNKHETNIATSSEQPQLYVPEASGYGYVPNPELTDGYGQTVNSVETGDDNEHEESSRMDRIRQAFGRSVGFLMFAGASANVLAHTAPEATAAAIQQLSERPGPVVGLVASSALLYGSLRARKRQQDKNNSKDVLV